VATISFKWIIVTMLKNNGVYEDAPVPDSIWSYTGMNGEQLYACFYPGSYCDIFDSPYVKTPLLLFADRELTDAGQEFLRSVP